MNTGTVPMFTTALISPRRMGKTGLIHHSFAQKEIRDRYYTFLIDIYATKNLQDLVYQMGQGIVNRLDQSKTELK